GGAYHRGDEGGRGGLATPCSAPVLVLEPGDVGLGNRKATAIGRRRTAAPTPLTGNEQHHERAGGNAYGPRSARLDLKAAAVPRPDTDHTGPSISPASMPSGKVARAFARRRFRALIPILRLSDRLLPSRVARWT